MEQENITHYQSQAELPQLCASHFQWTDSMFDKSCPNRYALEWQKNDELYESIAILDSDSHQVMFLQRHIDGGELATCFPYKLMEQTMGIDIATGMPSDVWFQYLLDTQGSFHHVIQDRERTIVALCGPDQQARLTRFLMKGSPGAITQYNQQAN